MGSILRLSRTKPSAFHISGGSSPRVPVNFPLAQGQAAPSGHPLALPASVSPQGAGGGRVRSRSCPPLRAGEEETWEGGSAECRLRRGLRRGSGLPRPVARGTSQLCAPLPGTAGVLGPAARRGGAPASPPPTRRSRAPPSGRRAASLRPRLVGGAAHVTALRACGRCRFPQSPSEREETRWRLKAIRSGAPAIRIEPSPSTRFRRPGPSRPAPRASPPGPGAPHRHPSARPSPLRFPFSPPPRLRHEGPAGQAA